MHVTECWQSVVAVSKILSSPAVSPLSSIVDSVGSAPSL